MSITETKVPNEILIRYADDGTIAGSHVSFLETVLRDDEVLSRKIVGPHPMGTVEFPTEVILSQALTDALTTIESLNAEKAELERQLAERPEVPGGELAPGEVWMRQARLALLEADLLHLVQPAIDALPEPDRTIANIEWEYSQKVIKDKPFVQVLAAALGLAPEQVDELFTYAATIE